MSRKRIHFSLIGKTLTGFAFLLFLQNGYAQETNELIMNGNQQYRAGSYSQAIVEYNKAVFKDSTNAVAKYNMAVAFYKSKDAATANNSWNDLLNNNNKQVKQQASYNMGVAASKDYEELKKKEAGSAKSPNNPLPFSDAPDPNAEAKQQLLEKSIESYKQALRLDPSDKQARENLQKALLELKKTQPKKKKEDDSKKNKPQPQQQNQKNKSKMNMKEAERQLKLLQQKEKEVKERVQQKQGQGGKMPKDW